MAPIDKDKLCDLFQLASITNSSSLKAIQDLGGDIGIAQKLQTDIKVQIVPTYPPRTGWTPLAESTSSSSTTGLTRGSTAR